MSEDNLERIMMLDFCMPGSDGNALPTEYIFGRAHPRAFGTVPKFLPKLLELNVPVGEVVRRATGLPAQTFNLNDRGIISEGALADLVLFNPDELADRADFANPHTPAEGIVFTMSRGEIVYRP
jgi:N-acyl-D-amino-acid deacylase